MLTLFLHPVIVAMVAIVFCDVLMQPGMILSWYTTLLDRIPEVDATGRPTWYGWIREPLGMCVYCFTGQLALWGYILIHLADYRWQGHILFVFMSIFYTKLFYAVTTH